MQTCPKNIIFVEIILIVDQMLVHVAEYSRFWKFWFDTSCMQHIWVHKWHGDDCSLLLQVCSTLSFSGSGIFMRMNRGFDVVVIDEAAQAVRIDF